MNENHNKKDHRHILVQKSVVYTEEQRRQHIVNGWIIDLDAPKPKGGGTPMIRELLLNGRRPSPEELAG
ncbi:MAG TPA: hypothetical protein VLX68_02140 [Chitinivibrionales bacterium]|nr:hypothetical protein [Chitinivibrionales bacterium]